MKVVPTVHWSLATSGFSHEDTIVHIDGGYRMKPLRAFAGFPSSERKEAVTLCGKSIGSEPFRCERAIHQVQCKACLKKLQGGA